MKLIHDGPETKQNKTKQDKTRQDMRKQNKTNKIQKKTCSFKFSRGTPPFKNKVSISPVHRKKYLVDWLLKVKIWSPAS